ncbi:MAG: hypothetical protein U0586_01930 [Candidatus Brocadiaceae bacterium]
MSTLKDRVINLEQVLEEYIRNVGNAQIQTEKELREFKNEMGEFKDEMREFKNEMLEFKDEMRGFKGEMTTFKDGMQEDRNKFFRQLGDIANRMGTIVEDIVAPNIPAIAGKHFGCKDMEFFGLRITKRHSKDKSQSREFDIIAVFDDKFLINETKSTPRTEYINDFQEILKEIFDYFPEHRGKIIIPIFSSLYIPDNILAYLTRIKIYAMGIKDDTMDILNPPSQMALT